MPNFQRGAGVSDSGYEKRGFGEGLEALKLVRNNTFEQHIFAQL
jgi:hypothetical protein